MSTNRVSIALLLTLTATGCPGSDDPPPCKLQEAPLAEWDAPIELCSKYESPWPHALWEVQRGAEWGLYWAEAIFNALPDDTKVACMNAFVAARSAYIAADEAFVDAVNAAISIGNQDPVLAITELAAAVTQFEQALQDITSQQGCSSAAAPLAEAAHAFREITTVHVH